MFSSPLASGPVVRLLAATDRLADILPALHARAAEAAGASVSVLLELEAGTDRLRPTSGSGVDDLAAEAWLAGPLDVAMVADILAAGRPCQIGSLATASPELARRLGTPAAIVAPIVYTGQRLGLLMLGLPATAHVRRWSSAVTQCADAMALALSRSRLLYDTALQRDLQELVATLGRGGTPTLSSERFEGFCADVARLFGADRVLLWRHDREARRLVLLSASDPTLIGATPTLPATDAGSFVASALRQQRAGFVMTAGTQEQPAELKAVVPLRGRRRALGVLVFEGIRVSPGDEERTLDRLTGLSHQLANLLDAAQLLDEVLRTRRELENTFDSMRDLVLVCSCDGLVTYANAAAARRLGRQGLAVVSSRIGDLVGEALAEHVGRFCRNATADTESQTTEVDDPILGGTFQVTLTPLVNEERALLGSVLLAHDVSEERRLETERSGLRERLAKSEALGHLVAGIAHELNNPLQGVLGHLELISRTHQLPPRTLAVLRQVYRESDRAARIVRNLLLLAGSGRVALRSISLNAAVRRALALRASSCRQAGIALVRRLDDGLPRVLGDALLLQQAVLNIVLNAEQAVTESGGRIEIRTAYSPSRHMVSLEIHDSGPGIAAEALARVFDPFFTTKPHGSGLGLAMTHRIVHEHGGKIGVANHPSGGAVFTVQLPAASMVK